MAKNAVQGSVGRRNRSGAETCDGQIGGNRPSVVCASETWQRSTMRGVDPSDDAAKHVENKQEVAEKRVRATVERVSALQNGLC